MNIIEWISTHWGIPEAIQLDILYSIVIFVGLWILRYFSLKLIFKRVKDIRDRYYWKNGVKNAYNVLLIIAIGAIWIEMFDSFATFLGLATAGLAIALQSPIVNLAGWLFILLRRPFEVGDRIQIGGHAGDVIDIRFYQFTINEIGNWVDADQSTGRVIHIPNGTVFREPQANYTQGFTHIWHEIGVLITFESDWQKAKELLNSILKEHTEHLTQAAARRLTEASKKFMIFYSNLTPIIYTSKKDNGIMLTMRYLCNPKKRRMIEHSIWEDVLRQFAQHDDIDFAYPTQRIYFNPKEGKRIRNQEAVPLKDAPVDPLSEELNG